MIAHTRRGSGPPLVLIHALGADRRMWDPVLDRLAAERDVIAVDMPGFGESPPLAVARHDARRPRHARPTRESPVRWRAPSTRTSLALGLDRPHVAGNSLGGWVALELALAGHARSVTAIAPAGLWAQPLMPKRSTARLIARALRPVMPALLRSERGRRAALGGTIAHPERVPYDGRAAARPRVRGRARLRGGRTPACAPAASTGWSGSASRSRWPGRSTTGSSRRPRNVPATAREFVLRGCGHMPTWDDPEQVAEVLLAGSGG